MNVLAKYIAYHPDNYQGGSGKSFEFKTLVDISDEIKVSEVVKFVEQQCYQHGLSRTPWQQDFKISVVSMEVLGG